MKHNLNALSKMEPYETYPEMIALTQAELNDAIRKAVHAEREACEKIARLEGTVSGNNIAAAIRARGEGAH